MSTATLKKVKKEIDGNLVASQMFAQVFRAFLECSDEVQAAIREMVEIVNDPEASEDEKYSASLTISEALFPASHNGCLGIDLEECEKIAPPDVSHVLQSMDKQEATFGERVEAILDSKKMTQGDLATAVGIGQPAISMMLSRQCRPQRRTVEKIAKALGVEASEIWPELSE
jgi:lambda repressor-like predicted transcriptional regulator